MRIPVALILVVTAVNVIGRPHNDGTDHTHSPVIAPDSESVINIKGHNVAAVHHSDVGLGNHSSSNQTDLSHFAETTKEIAAAETHHSDTHLTSGQVTSKPQVGAGHATLLHVDHSGTNADHSILEGKVGTVLTHGPMAKNVENHEVKHNHDHDHEHGRHGHHDKHSTVHHAPMATEHHPKTSNAHHPQLSKSEPSTGHAPLVHPDEHHKHDSTDDAINEDGAVTSTVNHPPLATDHHAQKTILAHHPSLSKSEVPMAHAPLAMPHHNEKSGESGIRKKRSGPGGQTLGTHPKPPPRESVEEYNDSEEYPSKEEEEEEQIRHKRSKGSNQKSYVRKTTTTTTTTAAPPTEPQSSDATERASSDEPDSDEKTAGSGNREKRSKGSNQKTNVRKTTTTTTTTTVAPAPTASKVLEASHRGSSEEQDSKEQSSKKPEEREFREKRSKGSNRKPAAYTRTTTTTTEAPKTTQSTEPTDDGENEGEPKVPVVREKRSKGSNQQKSYARKTTTTTTTTVAPTTLDSSNPSSVEPSEEPESHDDAPEEPVARSKRSKGGNNSFAKKALTTRNYPTSASTTGSPPQEPTEVSVAESSDVPEKEVRVKRSKGSYQKTQPRKTTTTTTTAKPTTSVTSTLDVSEAVTVDSSESVSLEDVTSEKTVRDKRSKGSNQNSYAKKHTTTTTVAPKAPEPEVPASNVHHPSLSKTEPLNPAKPEEPKTTKPEAGNLATAPEPTTKSQPPQIIPGSHPLAIPLPTNPPA